MASEVIKRSEDLQKIKDEILAEYNRIETSQSNDGKVVIAGYEEVHGTPNQMLIHDHSPFRKSQKRKLEELISI